MTAQRTGMLFCLDKLIKRINQVMVNEIMDLFTTATNERERKNDDNNERIETRILCKFQSEVNDKFY